MVEDEGRISDEKELVPKTQETLRETQANKEKGLEVKITSEKLRKEGLREFSPPNP